MKNERFSFLYQSFQKWVENFGDNIYKIFLAKSIDFFLSKKFILKQVEDIKFLTFFLLIFFETQCL